MIAPAINRRFLLTSGAALAGTMMVPSILRAQEGPIVIGTLTPLTGAGGTYGPIMRDVVAAVVRQVNEGGGLRGREVRLVSEDDQTNPDAGVRAARKLIDVDKVSAIVGTWASSVTSAVAPLCWENQIFLTTVSGADSITQLPHKGFIVRTQPNTDLQGRKFGEAALEIGAKKLIYLGPQTPYAQSTIAGIEKVIAPHGGTISSIIYDGKKPSYRSEVDEALRGSPDLIVMGGFSPDTTILLKDLFRANFKGKLIGFGFAITPTLLGELPADVVEGIYVVSPSPAIEAKAYKTAITMMGKSELDTYSCQVFDQINLVLLAIAAGDGSTGTHIRDAIRLVSQGDGPVVEDAAAGLRELAQGKKQLNYEGASGSCTFNTIGDVEDAKFRFDQVKSGRLVLMKIA